MHVSKLLSLISTVLGALGAILIAYSVLFKMGPETISKITTGYYGFDAPKIEDLCSARADTLQGISIVVLAAIVQVINLSFDRWSNYFIKPLAILCILLTVITVVCWLVFLFQSLYLSDLTFKAKSHKLNELLDHDIAEYLPDYIAKYRNAKFDHLKESAQSSLKTCFDPLVRIAEEHLDFDDVFDKPSDRLRALAKLVKVNIPEDFDFEGFEACYSDETY